MDSLKKLIFLLLIYPPSIFAAIVDYSFTARIASENTNGLVAVNDLIQGSFSFDSSIILSGPTSSNFFTTPQDRGIFGLNLTIKSANLFQDDAIFYTTGVTTNFSGSPNGAHMFSVSTLYSATGWPSKGVLVSLSLIDSTGSVFSDNTLPDTLNLNDFDSNSIVVSNDASSPISWRFDSNIINLQPTVVPLPPAIFLFSSGLFLIFRYRQK